MRKIVFALAIICTGCLSFAQAGSNSRVLNGRWIFMSSSEIDLGRIPENQLPQLVIDDSTKHFSGSAGCNKINGSYETDADEFSFGPMISTFKSCPDMQAENYITRFLPQVGSYKVEDNRLYLYDKNDKGKFIVYRRG